MGLIKYGNLTNACIVLFAKKPSLYIPQSRIRLTVYPSSKTEDKFVNDRIFEGDLFKNIITVLNFIDITFGRSIVVEGESEGEGEGVNEELNLLFQAVVNNPGLKAPAIAEIIDKSLSSTERYIRKLKKVRLIEYKGVSKKGGYFITDST